MINFDNQDSKSQTEDSVQRGLKPSKKFANGSVHENGTGKFEILDRYLDNNIIMLKFKWLTGEFEGDTETNKEVNVNASIWKFKKVRGLTGGDRKVGDGDTPVSDAMEELRDWLEEAESHREEVFKHFEKTTDKLNAHSLQAQEQHKVIISILNRMDEYVDIIDNLTTKLIERDEQVNRLISLSERNASQIEALVHNYDIATKLIDKM